MKKILLLIMAIMLMITPRVNALTFYESVTVNTSFSEEIDINSIEKIYVTLEDATQEAKVYTLKQEDGFSTVLTNIAAGTLRFDYGVVDNDKIGKYKITGNVNISSDYKTATVNLLVENQINNSHDNELSDEVLDIIYDNKKTTTTTTKKVEVNNDTEIVIGGNNESTTTTSTQIIDSENNDKIEEEKKVQNRKKNDLIGIVIFSILGIIILIGLLFVIVKISKANK